MARPVGIPPAVDTGTSPSRREPPQVTPEDALGGMFMLAIPEATYVKLAEAAKKRGVSLAVLLGTAISEYLAKTEASGETPKRLLMEDK